jgi:hypothetical protein
LIGIPFETERAALRGDNSFVRLNQDATAIPAHRIRGLPIVDGKMGEHVLLDGGVELYFPFGRIVSASMSLLPTDAGYTRAVNQFDAALGRACAREDAGGKVELRMKDEMISVVRHVEGGTAQAPAYKITRVAETRWLDGDATVRRLHTLCLTRPLPETRTAAVEAEKPMEKAAPKPAAAKKDGAKSSP